MTPAKPPAGNILRTLTVAKTLKEPFTLEDLIVACWLKYPDHFGMEGYAYPHAVAVICKVYGATGLVQRGYLEFLSTKVLRVTAKGRKVP